MDYLSYGYALAITLGGVIGYVKAGECYRIVCNNADMHVSSRA